MSRLIGSNIRVGTWKDRTDVRLVQPHYIAYCGLATTFLVSSCDVALIQGTVSSAIM